MSRNNPIVAIVGRPNVGKSTLFNRIAQKRKSITHHEAGITRDRVYELVNWSGRQFMLIDTGGFVPKSEDKIESAIRTQVGIAVEETDLILFMVDGRESVTSMDTEISQMLRKSGKAVILVVNKCDNEKTEEAVNDFYEMGIDEPFPISAQNGRRIGDLLDKILESLPKEAPEEIDKENKLKLAIVGMPNAGKSSLVNALLGTEKAIVTDIPGTTRDSIDTDLKYYNERITIIDTAGLRRKRRVMDNVEFYSAVRANAAIDRCNIAVLVIDAPKGFTRQDAMICRSILDKKKGLIIAINKWDIVKKETQTMQEYSKSVIYQFRALEHYPILFISALTGRRIFKIIDTAREIHKSMSKRIGTNQLVKFFQKVIDKTPPPSVRGKYIKIKYVTQVKNRPPVFAFFCNDPDNVPEEYRRFLENQLRLEFGFKGIPIIIRLRRK